MKFEVTRLSLESVRKFSAFVLDYVNESESIRPFIQDFPNRESLRQQILRKQQQWVNRDVLQQCIQAQFAELELHPLQKKNLDQLTDATTFTICTAHQPNLFSGHLYLIYKIVHAIELAAWCEKEFPEFHFVPVYYIGSEDHDLDEIGAWNYEGQTHHWQSNQQGACGSMVLENIQPFLDLIRQTYRTDIPEENALLQLIESAYQPQHTLTQAIRRLMQGLFAHKGLLMLDANDASLKQLFTSHIEKECFENLSDKAYTETMSAWPEHYVAQAYSRSINLFYLKPQLRARIEQQGELWQVVDSAINWDASSLQEEIKQHPERFSPNVITRPMYQECILPNIAFVGGGGELAYWAQLKKSFDAAQIVFPILILRNSFQLVTAHTRTAMQRFQLTYEDLFQSPEHYTNQLLQEHAVMNSLAEWKSHYTKLKIELQRLSAEVNQNLQQSAEAHLTAIDHKINRIEEKFRSHLRKEHTDLQHRFRKWQQVLLPEGHLQERHDNLLTWFKRWHQNVLINLHHYAEPLGKEFIVIEELTESDK